MVSFPSSSWRRWNRKKPLFDQGNLDGTPVSLYAGTVKNFHGEPIGVLVLAKDRSLFASAFNQLLVLVIGLSIASVVVIGVLVWLISKGVVKPISAAAEAMEGIASADGDLTVRMDEQGKDEVARLSRAYNRFAEKTEHMIS